MKQETKHCQVSVNLLVPRQSLALMQYLSLTSSLPQVERLHHNADPVAQLTGNLGIRCLVP